jgi:mono/diheme cytochrome c family protein
MRSTKADCCAGDRSASDAGQECAGSSAPVPGEHGDSCPTIIRVAGGFPDAFPLTVTLTTAISAPAQMVNGDASMGQQLAQKWCNDCHAVGAEDAEAYGSVPSFVLIAEKCFVLAD